MTAPYFDNIFEYPIKEFISHLQQENNSRIVFSGKYGSGKTSFIKNFFTPENQQKHLDEHQYEVFHLFPVNYSVAANSDIIRYIKYDLVYQLLQKAIDISEIELGFIDTLPAFLKNNLHKLAANIVSMIPLIGKDIYDAWEKLDKLKDEFLKFHDETANSDGDKMVDYLQTIQNEEGSLYDNDVMTKLIAGTIAKKPRKSVLIIDDLDRLDPEHIFRILNVFAAHFDFSDGNPNKFGFDKIILVCDFKNIRQVFEHKYGLHVDFNGYANKFYSSDIYQFDNARAVATIINHSFQSIKWSATDDDEEQAYRTLVNENNFLQSLTAVLLQKKMISLRTIIKQYGSYVGFNSEKIEFDKHTLVPAFRVISMVQLRVLRNLIGDYDQLISIIKNLESAHVEINNYVQFFKDLCLINYADQHNFYTREKFLANIGGKVLLMEYEMNMNDVGINRVYVFTTNGKDPKGEPIKVNSYAPTITDFWEVLLQALNKLYAVGYIK